MKLRKLSKDGKEMFVKDYGTQKAMAESIIKSYSNYSTGEVQWEVVVDEPKKSKGRPKKNQDEDSQE